MAESLAGPCSLDLAAIPLNGCTYGVYGATFALGGQALHLLVDTGSTTLAVASSTCSNCNGIAPLYTPGSSAAYVGVAAQAVYGDGSGWAGWCLGTIIRLASLPPAPVAAHESMAVFPPPTPVAVGQLPG